MTIQRIRRLPAFPSTEQHPCEDAVGVLGTQILGDIGLRGKRAKVDFSGDLTPNALLAIRRPHAKCFFPYGD